MYKIFLEEEIFYNESSFKQSSYAFNCVEVLNNGWCGSVKKIHVTFTVESPRAGINLPTCKIYTDYPGKENITQDVNGHPFSLTFDNNAYHPEVAIITNDQGVTIDDPKPAGNDSYTIRVHCDELEAKSCFSITILWFNAKNLPVFDPIVKINKRQDPCTLFYNRPFWNKYHLMPLLLLCLGCLSFGINIGILLPREKETPSKFQELVTLDNISDFAKFFNKELTKKKRQQ